MQPEHSTVEELVHSMRNRELNFWKQISKEDAKFLQDNAQIVDPCRSCLFYGEIAQVCILETKQCVIFSSISSPNYIKLFEQYKESILLPLLQQFNTIQFMIQQIPSNIRSRLYPNLGGEFILFPASKAEVIHNIFFHSSNTIIEEEVLAQLLHYPVALPINLPRNTKLLEIAHLCQWDGEEDKDCISTFGCIKSKSAITLVAAHFENLQTNWKLHFPHSQLEFDYHMME